MSAASKATKTKSKIPFQSVNCSPSAPFDSKPYTCFTDDLLRQLADKWNLRHPDDLVKLSSSRVMWEQLRSKMQSVCHTESCWLRQPFVGNAEFARETTKALFMPPRPRSWRENPSEWLTSTDITRVMRRYERAYPSFVFIGPSPIDYDHHYSDGKCVWEELCNLNIAKMLEQGKTKIGIIFNTDPHYKEGSHWVSMFVNLKEKYVFFMDSTGDPPQRQIQKLMNCIIRQSKELGSPMKKVICRVKHQRRNTECGMYCIFAIVGQLTGEHGVDKLCSARIEDNAMAALRDKYFNRHL